MDNKYLDIVNNYNKLLWQSFKNEIDKTIQECEEKKYNPIDTFCHIIHTLNGEYQKFNYVITGCEVHPINCDDGLRLLHEDVINIIFDYLDPYFVACYNEIKKLAEEVLMSNNLEELTDNYQKLMKIFEIDEIWQYKDCFIIDSFNVYVSRK